MISLCQTLGRVLPAVKTRKGTALRSLEQLRVFAPRFVGEGTSADTFHASKSGDMSTGKDPAAVRPSEAVGRFVCLDVGLSTRDGRRCWPGAGRGKRVICARSFVDNGALLATGLSS
jgi:hypothetical protein